MISESETLRVNRAFYKSFLEKDNKEVDVNDKSLAGPYIVDEEKEIIYAPTEGN